MKNVQIYTDGACSGNPGKGGWAAILIYGDNQKRLSGYNKYTTNNRMELFGVIKGVEALKEACNLEIYSDSAYVVNAFNNNWIASWQSKGWVNGKNEEVKNMDLWKDLVNKLSMHKVTFIKVKGHSDNVFNNECDKLAREAIVKCVD